MNADKKNKFSSLVRVIQYQNDICNELLNMFMQQVVHDVQHVFFR